MHARIASLAVALALAPDAARAGAPACKGRLSGSVHGKFGCAARVTTNAEGRILFVITPKDPIENVPTYQPGSFELPHPPAVETYTLGTIGLGMASVAKEGGTLFTATKTSGQRGELTLTFRTVKADPKVKGAYAVRGSYRARLVPTGYGKQGEVIVEVDF